MRRGAEDAGNGKTDLIVLRVFEDKLRATALAFEFDDIARERERADDGETAEWVLRYKQLIEAVRSVCDDAQIRDILAIVDRG